MPGRLPSATNDDRCNEYDDATTLTVLVRGFNEVIRKQTVTDRTPEIRLSTEQQLDCRDNRESRGRALLTRGNYLL